MESYRVSEAVLSLEAGYGRPFVRRLMWVYDLQEVLDLENSQLGRSLLTLLSSTLATCGLSVPVPIPGLTEFSWPAQMLSGALDSPPEVSAVRSEQGQRLRDHRLVSRSLDSSSLFFDHLINVYC